MIDVLLLLNSKLQIRLEDFLSGCCCLKLILKINLSGDVFLLFSDYNFLHIYPKRKMNKHFFQIGK